MNHLNNRLKTSPQMTVMDDCDIADATNKLDIELAHMQILSVMFLTSLIIRLTPTNP
jgi:hypothetical protein